MSISDIIEQERSIVRRIQETSARHDELEREARQKLALDRTAADEERDRIWLGIQEKGHKLQSANEFLKAVIPVKYWDSIQPTSTSGTPAITPQTHMAFAMQAGNAAYDVLKADEAKFKSYKPAIIIASGFCGLILLGGICGKNVVAAGIGFGGLMLCLAVYAILIARRTSPATRYAAMIQSLADSRYWHQQWQKKTSESRDLRVSLAEAKCDQTIVALAEERRRQLQQFHPLATAVMTQVETVAPSWRTASLETWSPAGTLPTAVRLGTLQIGHPEPLALPALLPFPMTSPVIFEADASGKAEAVSAIHAYLLHLLAAIPPGKLRFTFVDPVGLGQNVAPFMHLHDHDEALVTGKAWTDPQHIQQRLDDLAEHLENVIQKYLRTEYATIEDYNMHAGEVAEPYRVLVVLDFPANFTENIARRLVSIAQNGPRCGVHAIILLDTQKPLPYGFSKSELEYKATLIPWSQGCFLWADQDFRHCRVMLEMPPDAMQVRKIVDEVGQAAKSNNKVEVPFERIAPPQDQWWAASSQDGLRVGLGPLGANKVQYLELGRGTAQHVLVAGKTGSGKSTLLHTLIVDLALTYSPPEVELFLIDFKKGIEFKTYATQRLPHARVIAIESEREFGLSVLQGLDAELRRRGDLFRAAAVDGLSDYRRNTGKLLPRLLLIVDEFQEFFTEDDSIASQSSQILDRLVRQGRAFGLHVLLGSQTLAGAYSLARSTIDQMAVRIALQCSEADSRLILADDNPAARLLSRPGEAIYNAANGMIEGNSLFQVAWLSDEQRDTYLARMSQYQSTWSPIIFEGDEFARIEANRFLSDLLAQRTTTQSSRVIPAWLGDPIAIRDAVTARFRRQSGSNLLIVGQNEEAAAGLMLAALLSFVAQIPVNNISPGFESKPQISILDFGSVDAPNAEIFENLAHYLPYQLRHGRRRQMPEIINELASDVQQRMDSEEVGAPTRYLFVYGLQRARDLRQEETFSFSSFSDEPAAASSGQQFTTIVREGPEVGVHTIVWCDTGANVNRSLERRILREFTMRVVFQMSGEDSQNLIDSQAASKLGQYRAFFYDEEESRLEKFRPYSAPSQQWLEAAIQKIDHRP